MTTNETPNHGLVLSNSVYDKLKFLVQVVLPAIGTLYASLAIFWGFPHPEEVVGSVTAIALFFGLLMGKSSSNYVPEVPQEASVGDFVIQSHPDGSKAVKLNLNQDPETFVNDQVIVFNLRQEEVPEEGREENSY